MNSLLTEPETLEQLMAAEPAPASLPGVYRQPQRSAVRRGLADVEALSRQWTRAWLRKDVARIAAARQSLEHEFTPLMDWALASWDFLLTAEGCRFLLRKPGEKWGAHGDYRACESPDYHRLVIHCFRELLQQFAAGSSELALIPYLAESLWPTVRAAYQALSQPPDARQRTLTAYSYLRCVPYQFLNRYHHTLVQRVVQTLAPVERGVIDLYYLHFFTEQVVAATAALRPSTAHAYKLRALRRIAQRNTLTCALLLQIERY